MMGSRIKEEEIIDPALKYVYENPNCTTEAIKAYLTDILKLSPEDEEILAGRNDSKFSQIVRNLISHYDNNKFGRYTTRTKVGTIYHFILNAEGVKYLNEIFKEEQFEVIEDNINCEKALNEKGYSPEKLETANNRMPEPGSNGISKRYKTDPSVAHTALQKCNYLCEYAKLIGKTHETFDAKKGNLYLEAHHLIPMKAQKDFLSKNLDRTENIVGLCPICHAAVHHGTVKEKRKILQALYEDRIEQLKNCSHHIDISLSELLLKYYI